MNWSCSFLLLRYGGTFSPSVAGHCCHLLLFLLEYEMFLAFSKVTGIETLHMLTEDELPNPNAPMPPVEKPDQMLNVIGLAFDYKTKRYFFSDIQRGYIMSVYFNGTGFETIVESRWKYCHGLRTF